MGRLFCRNYDYHTKFTRFRFSASNFCVLFSIIHFVNFCAKLFKFLLFRLQFFVCQLSDSKFSSFCFSHFCFSSVNCQTPTFRLLLAIPIFTLLLCKLLAETNAYFLIVFICVISAQLPHNVLWLECSGDN
jgi:hypothetical protein